jgi:hypothetical protein
MRTCSIRTADRGACEPATGTVSRMRERIFHRLAMNQTHLM